MESPKNLCFRSGKITARVGTFIKISYRKETSRHGSSTKISVIIQLSVFGVSNTTKTATEHCGRRQEEDEKQADRMNISIDREGFNRRLPLTRGSNLRVVSEF